MSTRTSIRTLIMLIAVGLVLAGVFQPVAARNATIQTDQPTESQSIISGTYRGVSTAVDFDISPPLRSIAPNPVEALSTTLPPERPSGLEGPLGPQDKDPLVQSVNAPNAIPLPAVSFNGPDNIAGVSPPDPVGDVGPNHYVAMSNLYFAIYSKTGALLYGPAANNTLWAGFGGACETENAGDPIVAYDQLADRWLLTQFTAAGPTYYNCVAISQTGDPTGAFYRYAFSTGSNFPDYPKYGVWSDAYYISTREFAGASFAGIGAYAINRAQMIAGNPAPQVISYLVTPAGAGGMYNIGDGLLPTDIDGSTLPPANSPNYFVGSMDNGGPYGAPQDALTLWKFTANFSNPPASSFVLANTIPVAAFDTIFPCTPTARDCIPQPGTTTKLDILSYRQRPLWRLAYRNFGTHESLVTNQAVEAATGIAGIRWWEIRSPNNSPTMYQEGTYAPGVSDGIHRWMGSIAQDAHGNMALGYSASNGTTTYPSVWYTGRLSTDSLGTMPQGEASIVNGTGSLTGSQRWGDYTSMNIDPLDDCTFWFVNQFLPATSTVGWRLRVGAFKFPTCGSNAPRSIDDSYTAAEDNPLSIPGTGKSQILTTLLGGTGQSGNMFNLTAIKDIRITGFDVRITDTGSHTVEVYYKTGSYVGFETNPGAWTVLGSTLVNSAGLTNLTHVDIGGLEVPAGQTYGLYLQVTTSSFRYTSGANTYNNGDLQLTLGTGLAGSFGASGVFSPRTWNGVIHYLAGVLANDFDPNGDSLSASLQSGPSHGTVAVNLDGSFIYTPTINFFGTDTFIYITGDGVLTETATVSIDVIQRTPLTVTITCQASDAILTWQHDPEYISYQVWSSTIPYFSPGEVGSSNLATLPPPGTGSTLVYTDTGAIGNVITNTYYLVRGLDALSASNFSNRTGEFDYATTPGSGADGFNVIGLPLDVSAQITDAVGLANYLGASVQQVLHWDAASQTFEAWYPPISFGVNFPLLTGQAYWVQFDSSGPSVVSFVGGVPPASTISFSMLGASACLLNEYTIPLEQDSIGTAVQMSAILGDVEQMLHWDAPSQTYEAWYPDFSFGIDFPIKIGHPYHACLRTGVTWP